MVNCSAITNAPASTGLLKYLRSSLVNDKNDDGEIDLAQEVITSDKQEQAALNASDINGDGKLIGAEIRYFLNFRIMNVPESVMKENPLTEADRDFLACSFRDRAKACSQTNDDFNDDFKSADEAAALSDLARAVPKPVADADKERAAQRLQDIFEAAAAICGSSYRYDAQEKIVSIMAEAGVDKGKVTQLFQSIVDAVNSNMEDDPPPRDLILKSLAEAMSQAGVDKGIVAYTFQLAIAQSEGVFTATTDLFEIAMAMYRSAMNEDEVAAAIRLLMATASKVPAFDSVGRGQGLMEAKKVLTLVPGLGEERLGSLRQALKEMAKSMNRADKRCARALRALEQNSSTEKPEISGGGGR